MIVDCHCHFKPASWNIDNRQPHSYDLEGYLDKQAAVGIDVSVCFDTFFSRPSGWEDYDVRWTVEYNDWAADITTRYGGRLRGIAIANPLGGEADLRETERAVRQLGAKAVAVNSSVHGEYLDSAKAEPFFQLLDDLRVPLFIHPPYMTAGADKMADWRLVEIVGRPFDSVLNLARMMHGGVFDRHPSLQVVAAHVGGAITALLGRLDMGYEMRDNPSFGPWGPNTSEHAPSHYIRKLVVDSMGLNTPHVMCAIEHLGADRIVFGSDYPPVPIPLERSLAVVRDLPVSDGDKAAILGGNASRLLGLGG